MENQHELFLVFEVPAFGTESLGWRLEKLSSAIASLLWMRATSDNTDAFLMGFRPALGDILKVYTTLAGLRWSHNLVDHVAKWSEAEWRAFDGAVLSRVLSPLRASTPNPRGGA